MASNGHFNIRFCTVTVNIYRLLKRNYGIGDQSFRTVTVDIYLYKKRIKKIIDNAVFVQYLLIFILNLYYITLIRITFSYSIC